MSKGIIFTASCTFLWRVGKDGGPPKSDIDWYDFFSSTTYQNFLLKRDVAFQFAENM